MTLENLRKIARGMVPGLKTTVVSNALLDAIINSMVSDVTQMGRCLKTSTLFNVTSGTGTYNITSAVSDFLSMDSPGIWWDDGSQWQQLNPVTIKYLDDNYPTWRNDASGDPLRYAIDSDVITFHPTPNTTLASGFKIYHIKAPVDMSSITHYPFSGSTTEYPFLKIFDWAIIHGVVWKLKAIMNKSLAEYNKDEDFYTKALEKASAEFDKRIDISAVAKLGME